MKRSIAFVAAVTALFCFAAVRCPAALVVDQVYDVGVLPYDDGTTAVGIKDTSPAWQTFTVGIAGQLAKVDLGVYATLSQSVPLTVGITSTNGGQPDLTPAGLLASRTVEASEVPVIPAPGEVDEYFSLSVDFSAELLDVAAGEHLAIVVRTDLDSLVYSWWVNKGEAVDGYPGGKSVLPALAFRDSQFRTVVDTVPEPATLTLAGLALFGAIASRRRRLSRCHLSKWDERKSR
jgi:hypothetical protein